jgi:hypothetical protein
MNILSTSFSPSESTAKNISNTIFNAQFLQLNETKKMEEDLFQTLIQYNAVFYSLVSSYIPLYQTHPDVSNFMHNSFNDYIDAIKILLDRFMTELKIDNKTIIIYFIVFSILLFIITLIFYILIVLNFISATKSKINYMQVFYGIDSNSIKKLMNDCEKLAKKLKKNKGIIDEEDSDEELEDKKSFFQNKGKIDNSSRDSLLNNNIDNKKNNGIISSSDKIYIIFLLICLIGQYILYPYNFYLLNNINNKSLGHYTFFYSLNDFHSSIINLFNVYREYLFDDKVKIHNLYSFDYLTQLEIMSYNTIPENLNYLNYFWSKYIEMNDDLIALSNNDLCSYYETDYFDKKEDCLNDYKYIIKYDYNTIFINFVQNIRYVKHIAKYRFETENIVGKLSSNDDTIEKTIEKLENNGQNYTFRLDVFNDNILHSDFNKIFLNVIIPYFDQLRIVIFKNVSIDEEGYIFITIFCIYIPIIAFIYFIYLFPMIRYLNNSIYKTKKILLIIPIKILTSQVNIKSLFNSNK